MSAWSEETSEYLPANITTFWISRVSKVIREYNSFAHYALTLVQQILWSLKRKTTPLPHLCITDLHPYQEHFPTLKASFMHLL